MMQGGTVTMNMFYDSILSAFSNVQYGESLTMVELLAGIMMVEQTLMFGGSQLGFTRDDVLEDIFSKYFLMQSMLFATNCQSPLRLKYL